uniref:Uncharacterized protein n=1 Tax=Haptolina brevifila TaxID=156173 RepID=A0A7S2BGB6_9EUKA
MEESGTLAWTAITDFMHQAQKTAAAAWMGNVTGAAPPPKACWAERHGVNLLLRRKTAASSGSDRCSERRLHLAEAQAACDTTPWCGGITRDGGIPCGLKGRLEYELRRGEHDPGDAPPSIVSWMRGTIDGSSSACMVTAVTGRSARGTGHRVSGKRDGGARVPRSHPASAMMPADSDRLGSMLREKHLLAQERVARGPPAYERFPTQAFRYRDWGDRTRHGRGDAYPLYTLDTLRNLADHLFDSSTGYQSGPSKAVNVQPCELVYSTLRPTHSYIRQVHAHIRGAYLLITDTADLSITHSSETDSLLGSDKLSHWWAVDNEVLDRPKIEGLPLGVMDSLEVGMKAQPGSVHFHARCCVSTPEPLGQ